MCKHQSIDPTFILKLGFSMGKEFGKPKALSVEEIKETVNQFAYAAEIAYRTG